MCRRPLLPLLALAVLMVNLPSSHALSCYQCSDKTDLIGTEGGGGLIDLPTCSEFDEDKNEYQQHNCLGSNAMTCSKVTFPNGEVVRGCFSEKPAGCTEMNGITECFCTSDYCNSAGLAVPALCLLLPSALVAALYTA